MAIAATRQRGKPDLEKGKSSDEDTAKKVLTVLVLSFALPSSILHLARPSIASFVSPLCDHVYCRRSMDRILVNQLLIDQLELSPAPWAAKKHQPAYLTVSVLTDTSRAGATDDLQYSISYAEIAKGLRTFFASAFSGPPLSAHGLAEQAAQWLLFELQPSLKDSDIVQIRAELPEALLHGGTLVALVQRNLSDYSPDQPSREILSSSRNARNDSLLIEKLQISTIIGLNDCERKQEQPLLVEVETWPNFEGLRDDTDMAWCAKSLQETVWQVKARIQSVLVLSA